MDDEQDLDQLFNQKKNGIYLTRNKDSVDIT